MVAISFYNNGRSFYIGGHIILQWWPHPTTMVATYFYHVSRILLHWKPQEMVDASYCNGGFILQWVPHPATMIAFSYTIVATFY
jgi:hypothetical protein